MGYSTDFEGAMTLTPALTPSQMAIICDINLQRHGGNMQPFPGVPGFWCHWDVQDYNRLVWDGGEKTYDFPQWLEYLIENHFKPWGVKVSGKMLAMGERKNDRWTMEVGEDQKVIVKRLSFEDIGITY